MNEAMLERPAEGEVAAAPPQPVGRRAQIKATNRQAILSAAREVFAEMGFGATTVRDIIRRTGLASGTFYNYFRSKEEVFEAIMDDNALSVRPRLREARVQATTFEEFVRETFRVFFDFCVTDRGAYAVIRRNSGQKRVRMDTPEVMAGFEELRADLEAAMARGVAPRVDAGFLTASLIGIAFEIADEMFRREPFDAQSATEFATALFLGGVRALAQGENPE